MSQNRPSNPAKSRESQCRDVQAVVVSSQMFLVGATHALSTERDEVCGLLFGQPIEGGQTVIIKACLPLPRGTHRQKDRIEITAEQQVQGVEYAQTLAQIYGMKGIRLVGWYHSHPRLMPMPSPVDVRSQEACELQDPTFVGLIFAPFNTVRAAPMLNQLQLLAFKTDRGVALGYRQLQIEIGNDDNNLNRWTLHTLRDLLCMLYEEEMALMSQVQIYDSRVEALAKMAFSYRLTRLVSEIGEPLIAVLESKLTTDKDNAVAAALAAATLQSESITPRPLIEQMSLLSTAAPSSDKDNLKQPVQPNSDDSFAMIDASSLSNEHSECSLANDSAEDLSAVNRSVASTTSARLQSGIEVKSFASMAAASKSLPHSSEYSQIANSVRSRLEKSDASATVTVSGASRSEQQPIVGSGRGRGALPKQQSSR